MTRVPIEAVHEMGADYVIGIDVGYHGGSVDCEGSIVKIIMHTMEVMEWQIMQRTVNTADINIVPQLAHINLASMAQAEETIRIGRDEMERRMPEVLAGIEEKKKAMGIV